MVKLPYYGQELFLTPKNLQEVTVVFPFIPRIKKNTQNQPTSEGYERGKSSAISQTV